MFISILGLEPIYDEFRVWASNLVRLYFIESLSRFDLVAFCVYVIFLIVICHIVSFRVVLYFSYIKCCFIYLIMFRILVNCVRNYLSFLILFRVNRISLFNYVFVFINFCFVLIKLCCVLIMFVFF